MPVHNSSFSVECFRRNVNHKSVEMGSRNPSLCRGKHPWRSLSVHWNKALAGIYFWAINKVELEALQTQRNNLMDHSNKEDWLLYQEMMLGSFIEP